MQNNILTLIKELRTKRKFLEKQASDIDQRIKELKKQHFDADEEMPFTFELLEAVLADYLPPETITKVIGKLEVSFERLKEVLSKHLTEEQIEEIIDALKEV